MTVHYADEWLTVHVGDNRVVLAELEAGSVHTCVTSPPYWGLRDYGTATWDGGDAACDHGRARKAIGNTPSVRSTLTTNNGKGPQPGDKFSAGAQSGYAQTCPCGARRTDRQLGLEATPEEYVANMVAVFREVRRVLRDDGTLWLNLGDSYSMTTKGAGGAGKQHTNRGSVMDRSWHISPGLKPKDLVGIPWRVAFALQADGWYLRSDIIWAKPNPMPESVTDRPTKAHEYLFLLTKSPRYWYDPDAIKEEGSGDVWDSAKGFSASGKRGDAGHSFFTGDKTHRTGPQTGRNRRSVWTIATQPYPGAHFATFPPKLVEPCILAGTSERGVCPECGSPWRRVVERETVPLQKTYNGAVKTEEAMTPNGVRWGGSGVPSRTESTTTGWRPTCTHDATPIPATVLDPFGGSGTTAMVAQHHSRRAVLIDLNPDYIDQQLRRNANLPLGLEAA